MNEATGTEKPDSSAGDDPVTGIEAWRDPYRRRGPHYFEDEHGNSASRPILLTEVVEMWRKDLTATDANPSPTDFVRMSGLRLLIASGILEEFAVRLEDVPGTESFVELARELADDFADASWGGQ